MSSTLLEDIKFTDYEGLQYAYRNPQHQNNKKPNQKSLSSYGVCADHKGDGMYSPFYLLKVSNFFNVMFEWFLVILWKPS